MKLTIACANFDPGRRYNSREFPRFRSELCRFPACGQVHTASLVIYSVLLCLWELLLPLPVIAQQLVWLGTLEGHSSWAADVSADGRVVVGWITVKEGGRQQDYAFRWEEGMMQRLEGVGDNESRALAVSADGTVIVGWVRDSMGQSQMCSWQYGKVRQFKLPFGQQGIATDVSFDARVIVGYVWINNTLRAVRWSNGQFDDLGSLGGDESLAFAASADGSVVVGRAQTSDGSWYAFRWEQGIMRDLQTLGGSFNLARAVSASGDVVVGTAETVYRHRRAVRWVRNNALEDLGTLGGKHSGARAVSADGQVVVGWAMTDDGKKHAFRWTQERGMEDLNEMYAHLLTDGSVLTAAIALSSDGRFVVGNGWNAKTERNEVFWLDTQGSTGMRAPLEQDQQHCSITFDPAIWVLKVRCDVQQPLPVRITIFDALGRVVNSKRLWGVIPEQSPIQIPILPLSQGWYWCAVKIGDRWTIHPFFVSR